MDAGITEAELLQAIEEATNSAPEDKPGWRATQDWADFWGCSEYRADILLRRAHRAGILETDRIRQTNRVGAQVWRPVYKIRPRV